MWRCEKCHGTKFIKEITKKQEFEVEYNIFGDQIRTAISDFHTITTLKCAECSNKRINGFIGDIAKWEE